MIHIQYARISAVLVHKHLKVLRKTLKDSLINGLVILLNNTIMFGYLFPLMGMPEKLVLPVFIGIIGLMFFINGFGLSFKALFSLEFSNFMHYQLTLPMPKRWLFATYVTNFVIELLIITFPLTVIGIVVLGRAADMVHANWLAFAIIYLLSLICFALMFLFLVFWYPFGWYLDHIWPRRLSLLLCLSSVQFPLKNVYGFSPTIANIFLFNPISYITEGLRAALMPSSTLLSASTCILAILACTILFTFGLTRAVNNRLDPV